MTNICAGCIGEVALQKIVSANSNCKNSCDYCDDIHAPTVDIHLIAMKCDEVIDAFYELTQRDPFGRPAGGSNLDDTIADLVKAPSDVVSAISDALQLSWYDRDSGEEKYGDDPSFSLRSKITSGLEDVWSQVEFSLRYEGRYLNPFVADFFDEVFEPITRDSLSGTVSVISDAGPGTKYETIYRARVFQSEKDVSEALSHPERNLGTPPVGAGANGRMNAAGQPAFYGATDVETSMAEVRPPVGSWVIVAKFKIVRPLRLLNLKMLTGTKLLESVSLFDEKAKVIAERNEFLRTFSERMILPVMPENQDHSYLVTQVVASYLAMHPTASIDGIIYPSVQLGESNHENIVLFYKSAASENSELAGPTAHANLWEYDPDVACPYFYPSIQFSCELLPVNEPAQFPKRAPTLSLMKECIEIHKIEAIKVTSKKDLVEVIS